MSDATGQRLASGPAALPLAILLLAVLGVLLALGARPPAPLPASAPADEFSAGRAVVVLERLLAEQVPHRVGTPENFVVRDRILAELTSLGYEPHVQRAFACRGASCAWVENILARLAGSGSDGAVMLVSHYDSRGAGPGAADAGAAVAAILEVARIAVDEAPYHHDVVVLLTDGEEVGLLGAEAFVREHPWASDVRVAINLEARGSGGPSVMFETSDDNRWLVQSWARAASRPVTSSLTYDVYRLLPNDTDATVFRGAGMDVLNFAFIDDVVHYHSALDDLAHLDRRSVQHHGDNALAALRALAGSPLRPQVGDATYTDLFGRVVIVWPARWTLPLALLFAITLLAVTLVWLRRGLLRASSLAWGALAVLAGLAGGTAAGWLAGRLLGGVTGAGGLHAHAWVVAVVLYAAALAAVLATGALLAGRAGFRALLLAPWLLVSLLALALATRLPGATVVLLVPQAVAAVVLAALAFVVPRSPSVHESSQPVDGAGRRGEAAGDGTRRLYEAAAIIAALGGGLTLLQLARLAQSTFVLQMPFAIAAVVSLAALPLLPLTVVAAEGRRVRSAVIAASAIIAGAAFIAVAFVVPTWSERRPQPLNIAWLEDASGESYQAVQVAGGTGAIPEPLRSAGAFTDPLPNWLPGAGGLPAMRVEPAAVPMPRLEVLGERRDGDGRRHVAARLVPTRTGNRVLLVLPARALLSVEGHAVPGRRIGGERIMVYVHGVPADGVALQVTLPDDEPADLMIMDFTPGLPDAAAPLVHARPPTAAPMGDGDVTIARIGAEL